MHVAIQRDRSTGRVARSVQLMQGRRGDWFTARQVAQVGVIIYRDRVGHRAYLTGPRIFMGLPHLPVWPHLYKRWNVEKPCKPRQYSDIMTCETCDMAWDAHAEPPRCPRDIEERAGPVVSLIAWILAAAVGVTCWYALIWWIFGG